MMTVLMCPVRPNLRFCMLRSFAEYACPIGRAMPSSTGSMLIQASM
jgi:hypothetical protein